MGCTSSTEVKTNPHTGQVETKKKLGGAYPGQRRPHHDAYTPDAAQFGTNGQAVVHFKAYGGGNALTLVQQDGSNAPVSGAATPQYVQVTLPDGVTSGQTIHVQAPDGKVNAIVVPPGFGPGSTFTVEFADEPAPTPSNKMPEEPMKSSSYAPPPPSNAPTAAATPLNHHNNNQQGDDGFATGFHNPHYTPPPAAAATTNFSDDYYAQYPTTTQATSVGYK